MVHNMKQRSSPPLAVVGRSIGKPDFPGSSSSRKRTEVEERTREKLRQPMVKKDLSSSSWSSDDVDYPVKKPLAASSLARRGLHDNPRIHHDNGFV